MSDTFGEYAWAVRTYECGPDGAATMASVCNWLQEAASLNAEALSFSKSNFESADALVFRARRGDIDLNGHVNNVHYVEWLMEGRLDSAAPCRELDIVFKSETLAGEEVRVDSVETEPAVFIHRVYAPDGRDHVLARSK